MVSSPARYFPVRPEPLRMQAGLHRFGADFGNGAADACYFSHDQDSPRWLSEKSRVLAQHPERFGLVASAPRELAALERARCWMNETLARERGLPAAPALGFAELGAMLVEDFAILQRTGGAGDRTLLLHACFPSGWRPEQLLGQSFLGVHARVPEFERIARAAPSIVDAMIERGPYVRFVWTIAADDFLDHHPEQGQRSAWSPQTRPGFLRVERQVTVPLPDVEASLFLIRTYLYGFDELGAEQRATLAQALRSLPPAIARYKGLEAALPHALRLLSA